MLLAEKHFSHKPRILFVSHTARIERPYLDPSTRYRCYNIATELNMNNYRAVVVSQHEFEMRITDYEHFEYFLFQQ